MSDFVHLHLHTQFSLLDGAIRFDRLFKLANEYGMPACSITDHGNMFGAVDFYFTAKSFGIKPIIGCEAYIAPKSRFDQKRVKGEDNAFHIVLLAMNNQGYKNLLKLISFAHLEGFYYVPRIDKELLRKYHEGLICLTACLKGEIPSMILRGNEKVIHDTVEEYYSIFGDRLYFELQDNGLQEQTVINNGLADLSKRYGIPLVATNDCHYLRQEEAKAHELLLCIQTGKTMNDKDRLAFQSEEFYFKSKEKMASAFTQYPDALSNTMKIAEMCNVDIDVGTYHFPEFKLPDGQSDINRYFESLCNKGFKDRMGQIRASYNHFDEQMEKEYAERLVYEMDVIKRIGFASYFLIVSDFIGHAKSIKIPVGPGRGSAAGSLVAYCLRITDIDPIKYDLIFERFLNPERVSMPDIDVDFCKKRRDEVIKYVTEKYGKDNVAQIITFGTMQSKAAVRDVGRALGIPYAEVDKIAKLITSADNGIEKAITDEQQLSDAYRNDPKMGELLDNAMVLEGLARHASTHAAGIVIANKHLSEYLPLYKGSKGEIITQFAMKTIEKIGLIKIDFLGLETLTIIDEAIKLLKGQNIDLDISNIPLDDKKTYDLLSAGNTSGVFQLESRGMKDLLTKLRPATFEDIMPLIALYRPGPLKSGMVDEFIKRKNNPSLVKYETPLLEGVLKDTYGVIIYQEQIMKIATVLAKFSIKDADSLRKAMSKKIPEQIEAYREQFMTGAIENGVSSLAANKIYDVILQFGEYGFNKSHSTAYGLVSYQTAYLKAHHYVPYFAAILTSEVNDTDKMVKYITECREDGIEILPPDINKSDKSFTVVDNRIRFGLSGIKNVGDAALDGIIAMREELGEFTSFPQFLSAIDSRKANKKVMESLIKAGCFDTMGLKRSQLLYILQEKSDKLQKKDTRNLYQMDIFGKEYGTNDSIDIPEIEELTRDEILRGEKEALGFYFSRHPMEGYEELIAQVTPFDSQNLKDTETSEDISMVGMVSNRKEVVTKRGDKMAYLTLEDTKGTAEVIVFPDLYSKNLSGISSEKPLIVTGTLDKADETGARIKAKSITLLEDVAREMKRQVSLRIDCQVFKKEDLRKLKDILVSLKGKASVSLEFLLNGNMEFLKIRDLRVDPVKMDVVLRNFPQGVSFEVLDEILS
ncbi:MAG: DNA polymerase III subunit alpha [Syntrophobacterales bacterium]|jgi:DNA polymerase-3 subunit alpha|nr:DNA polymerase III subunit alpha [Syntrophobacterales bacterium]